MAADGRDPGLQPERTALAWQRTGVASLLVAGGAGFAAVHARRPMVLLVALAAVALTALTAVPAPRPEGQPYARLVRAAVATVALAVVGVLLAVG